MKEPEQDQATRADKKTEEKVEGHSPSSSFPSTGLTRRQWLQGGALGLVGLGLDHTTADAGSRIPHPKLPFLGQIQDVGGSIRGQGIQRRGTVIEVQHQSVYPPGAAGPNQRAIKQMVGGLMMKLTGETNPHKAWTRMVGPGDRVGILVDPEGSAVTRSRKELIDTVVWFLRGAGVQPNDIMIWSATGRQLTTLGYNLNWNRPGIKILGADQMKFDGRFKYKVAGGSPTYLSRIVSQTCTHLINIATLEDHPILGCRLCLAQQAAASMYNGRIFERYWGGRQGIPHIASWPIMRQRFMLHLIDGITGSFNGHLNLWRPQVLLGGTDPVAVDRMGFSLIETARRQKGIPVITGTRRTPAHINQAALLGVGVANLMHIKHYKYLLR